MSASRRTRAQFHFAQLEFRADTAAPAPSMRVLHLTTEFPPVIYGGLGTAVGGWVKACARAGLEVAVQLVEGPLVLDDNAAIYGVPLRRNPNPGELAAHECKEGIRFFQCSWSDAISTGVRAVQEWRPDVVHLHTAMLWYLASAIKIAAGKPLVFHVHSVDRAEYEIGNEPNPFLAHGRAQEEAIIGSDRLIALTRSEEILLRRYYPDATPKIRVVGNGIEDTPAALEACFSVRSRAVTVLYSGRLSSGRAYGSCSRQSPRCCRLCRRQCSWSPGVPRGYPLLR